MLEGAGIHIAAEQKCFTLGTGTTVCEPDLRESERNRLVLHGAAPGLRRTRTRRGTTSRTLRSAAQIDVQHAAPISVSLAASLQIPSRMNILVTHGSKRGATAEIASRIGDRLREAGFTVDVIAAHDVREVSS